MTDIWNSDVIADALRALKLDYVVVCPGSSFRGLHESLVNHLGNRDPEMILALHEENAVAIAHGYARVTGRPLGVIVHCNVGVMHASMAMYNAWCDRVPMMVLGGIGPLDSERRRTPVDWLHSVADQGALVRSYTKWDDQPLSVKGAVESLLRGFLHRGWTRDHLGLAPVDIDILAEPDCVVPHLLQELAQHSTLAERARCRLDERRGIGRTVTRKRPLRGGPEAIGLWDIGEALHAALAGRDYCLMRAPLGWQASSLPIRHPLDYLGADGAAGVGGATGMSVGSALALKGSGRIPVAVFGDGEFLMTPTALWTAVNRRIPVLIIVANNRGYYIDEQHQEVTAKSRNRPTETAWVGQRVVDPDIDLTAIAKAQGFDASEAVLRLSDLGEAVWRGVDAVANGACYFIDVHIVPDYTGFPH
ncbi:MAG: thiamine pyrophosphate-binding protein [Xanthobacteraceae bacterium]